MKYIAKQTFIGRWMVEVWQRGLLIDSVNVRTLGDAFTAIVNHNSYLGNGTSDFTVEVSHFKNK